MATRRNNYNAAVVQLGDILTRAEKQTGWHLTSDHDRMAFYSTLGQTQLPSTAAPCYPSSIDTLAKCILYLNEIKSKYNAHLADATVHAAADATNTIAAADATDQASAITLANELRTDYEAHRVGGAGGSSHTHAFTGTAHTHNLLLKNAAVADGATTRVNAGANLLGANTGGDITVTGGGANGGVVNATAGGTIGAASGGATAYHSPSADNINAVTAAAASDLATLKTLTLDLVTQFRQHLFIGPHRLDEDMTFAR